ncbi:L-serine ammonia-lyase, iron-sulfur-dependent, subunit alpha [Clostridiaceae bacterium M8S5]|nr:L-serine ammonia-lyase, iron-sulfur-dependent, subunit alpha [Clostridiaceae bacterium M8S5]
MDCCSCNNFVDILKKEVVPALGCTEPIAVALASAKAREILGELEKLEVYVSPNIYKNGMGVGIPGTGSTGLDIAAALGGIGGKAEAVLEVLKDTTEQDIDKAKEMISKGLIKVKIKNTDIKLYVEAVCYSKNNISKVIIEDNHSNIVLEELNDKVLFEKIQDKDEKVKKTDNKRYNMNMEKIYDFVQSVDIKEIEPLLEGAMLNKKIAEEGLKNGYGLSVGKTLFDSIQKGILSDDMQNYAMALTAAASDARMDGCMMSVMSNSGSGNQGITVMLPVLAVAEKNKNSEEELIRALALANLIAIYIKTHLGRLSALCGCVVASAGASCGITYLMGGKFKNIVYALKNMIGNITGMICDGAKTGCALKVSTGVSAAIQSALLAINDIEISRKDGIIHQDVEETIKNIAKIGSEGMMHTDEMILDIMINK